MPPLANARQLGLRRPSAAPQSVPQQDPNAQAQAAPRPRPRRPSPRRPQPARAPARGAAGRSRTGGLRRILSASTSFPALGSTAVVMTGDGEHLDRCRRGRRSGSWPTSISPARAFARTPSSRRSTGPGDGPRAVSALLREAVRAGVRAAQLTDGDVDPTLGAALIALGYDRDFSLGVDGRGAGAGWGAVGAAALGRSLSVTAVAGWRAIAVDDDAGTVTVPAGVRPRSRRDRQGAGRRSRRGGRGAGHRGRGAGQPRWRHRGRRPGARQPAGRSGSPTIIAPGSTPPARRSRSPPAAWPPRASPCAAGAPTASCATTCSIPPADGPRPAPGGPSAWPRRRAWTPTSPPRRRSCAASGLRRGCAGRPAEPAGQRRRARPPRGRVAAGR